MTPSAPSPQPVPSTMRTRVKWDNIAIVLIGVVVACFAVVGILASGAETTPSAPKPAASDSTLATETADEAGAETGTLTADDAQSLVDEARALMSEARWDEAADRLATVPEEFRASLGVEALEQELASSRARHEQLRAELDAAVEARQWTEAKALLASLTKLAPLDASLLETQAVIDAALNPMKPAAATKAPATGATRGGTTAATDGGGSNTSTGATKPAAQTSKPKPATTRPANGSTTGGGTRPSGGSTSATTGATSGGGTTGAAAGTGATAATGATGATGGTGGTIDLGALTGATLSPAEQAELEAALAALGAA